jgi:hypothetical protein
MANRCSAVVFYESGADAFDLVEGNMAGRYRKSLVSRA